MLFNLILSAPRASTSGKSLLSPIPGGCSQTFNSAGLLACFFPPQISCPTIPPWNPPCTSGLGFNPPLPWSPHQPLQTPPTWCPSDWHPPWQQTETTSDGCGPWGTMWGKAGKWDQDQSQQEGMPWRIRSVWHEVQEVGAVSYLAPGCGACRVSLCTMWGAVYLTLLECSSLESRDPASHFLLMPTLTRVVLYTGRGSIKASRKIN